LVVHFLFQQINVSDQNFIDKLVKSRKTPFIVIPVKTGIQENQMVMDSRFRGSDGFCDFLRSINYYSYKFYKFHINF